LRMNCRVTWLAARRSVTCPTSPYPSNARPAAREPPTRSGGPPRHRTGNRSPTGRCVVPTEPCDGKAGADRDVACDELRAGARHGLRSGSSETAVGRSGATVGRDVRSGLFMSVRNKTMGQGMDSTS